MSFPKLALLVVPLLLLPASPAAAWTAPTRIRMAEDAVRLLPPSLRLVLEHQREELLRGALQPMTDEDSPAHRPPSEGGTLDQEIASRIDAVTAAASKLRSTRDLARRFGELAHFVADASFPPGASGKEGAARYQDFGGFCESRLARIPLVFYGHEDEALEKDDARAFALAVLKQAHDEDGPLAHAYALAGKPPDPAAFDDRSVPFAVASLSYSRAVTHIVRAWLSAWGGANGDLRQTPYLKSARVYRRARGNP